MNTQARTIVHRFSFDSAILRVGGGGDAGVAGHLRFGGAILGVALLSLLLLASVAKAVTYTQGTPLSTGKLTTSVAVNQSSGDLYVSSAGVGSVVDNGATGAVQRFSSAGAELGCSLSPAPEHPAGLAIDPTSGTLYSVNLTSEPADGEVRAFAAGCGNEVATSTGTADTTAGSPELTAVATDHPLQPGQVISGPGIPTASATAEVTSGSPILVVSGVSGTLTEGQRVAGLGIPGGATITSVFSATELELSANATATQTGGTILARTTVSAASGTTATLSSKAEATGTGVAISGLAWRVEASGSAPVGQPAVDTAGSIFWPNRQANKLQKYSPWGAELVEGSFPLTTKRPASVALDAAGDVFVTTSGTSAAFTCNSTANAKLKKLGPNGEVLEGGPIGPESVFAGLTANATTVAVDKKTGNVYVGRGCAGEASSGETFKIEEYGPGGAKLAEFGAGSFGEMIALESAVMNQIAVDETTGTVYAADGGHQSVQVFTNSSEKKTFSASVSPAGEGEVMCNGTGVACLPEYDEGQEVVAEAVETGGLLFKEWANGTGSAEEACDGSTESSCAFLLEDDSTIEAVFGAAGPSQPLTVEVEGEGEVSAIAPPSPTSGAIAACVDGGGECAAEYSESAEVSLVATEAAGSHFVGWTTVTGTEVGTCTGTAASCETAGLTEAVTLKAVFAANPTFALTVEVEGEGEVTGTGIACTQAGNGGPECEEQLPEGTEAALVGTAAAGSHFVGWATVSGTEVGTCTGTAASCATAPLTEAVALKAVFEPIPTQPLEVNVTGDGEVTSTPPGIACTEASSPCVEEFDEGSTVPLTASPEVGWEFTGWGGACSGIGSCEVVMSAAKAVTATFAEITSSPLVVFVTGHGTVTSSPPGINCTESGGTCTEEYEGTVTLTGTPDAGWILAGWIGCRHNGTGTCEVTVSAPREVTAVFIKEGTEGSDGPIGPEGPPGSTGAPGPAGPEGVGGALGATGQPGAQGTQGAVGTQGPAGSQGPQGPEGKRGPAGKVKVTCKVKGSKKVTCTVKQPKSAQSRHVKWTLRRAGHVVSHGSTSASRLQVVLNRLRPGRYVLHVAGQQGGIGIKVGR